MYDKKNAVGRVGLCVCFPLCCWFAAKCRRVLMHAMRHFAEASVRRVLMHVMRHCIACKCETHIVPCTGVEVEPGDVNNMTR